MYTKNGPSKLRSKRILRMPLVGFLGLISVIRCLSFVSRHEWDTSRVQLPTKREIWFTDGSKNGEVAEAAIHMHREELLFHLAGSPL